MKIMKKFAFVLALTMLTGSFAACSKNTNKNSSGEESQESSLVSEQSEESLSSPSEATSEDIASHVSVDHILMAIASAYGDEYPANMAIPDEVLQREFDLTPDLYEEAKGEMAAISVQNDRVVVAKAAPGKADELEKALKEARQRKIDDTMQYPMNIPKTNAAKVEREGDYVAFLLVGVLGDVEDIEDPAVKQRAEEEVQKAVDAFHGVFDN